MKRIHSRVSWLGLLLLVALAGRAAGAQLSEDIAARSLELAAQTLHVKELTAAGPKELDCELPGGVLVSVVAARLDAEGNPTPDGLTDITASADGKRLKWSVPAGKHAVFIFTAHREKYIDPLNKAAVERLVKEADTPRAALASAVPANLGASGSPAWSAVLTKRFKEMHGYDLPPVLPALVRDIEGLSGAVRIAYFRTLTVLMREGLLSELNKAGGPASPLSFGPKLASCARLGDPFEILPAARASATGGSAVLKLISAAFAWKELGAPPGAALQIDETASFRAATRPAVESLLCGLQVPPPDTGKLRYPDAVKDYLSRLNAIVSGTEPVADLAFLFPSESFWANYAWGKASPICQDVEGYCSQIVSHLIQKQLDFQFISEEMLSKAEVRDGALIVDGKRFRALLVPAVTTMSVKAMQKVRDFTNAGGRVVAAVSLPYESAERGKDEVVRKLVEDVFGIPPGKEIKKDVQSKGNAHFVVEDVGKIADLLRPAVDDFFIYPYERELMYAHRAGNGKDVYLIANLSRLPFQTYVTVRRVGLPEIWDPETDRTSEAYGCQLTGEKLIVPVSFGPGQCRVLLFRKPLPDRYIRRVSGLRITSVIRDKEGTVIHGLAHMNGACSVVTSDGAKSSVRVRDLPSPLVIETPWDFSTERPFKRGSLEIKRVRCRLAGEGEDTSKWMLPEYDDSDWLQAEIGARLSILGPKWKGSWLPFNKPHSNVYFRKVFDLPEPAAKASLIITADDGYALYLNGAEVGGKQDPDGWRRAETYDITKKLVKGKNVLAVCVKNASGVGALLLEAEIKCESGKTVTVASDATWKISMKPEENGWKTASFDDKSWQTARAVGPPPVGPWHEIEGKPPDPELARKKLWYRFRVPSSAREVRLPAEAAGAVLYAGGKVLKVKDLRADLSAVAAEKRSTMALCVSAASPLQNNICCDCAGDKFTPGDWQEVGLRGYVGAATYKQKVRIPAALAREHLVLDLGDVRAAAEVRVNGRSAGTLLAAPYVFDVAADLREGDNDIEITVSNTMLSAAALPEKLPPEKQKKSGLIGPVRIVPLREVKLTIK